jgi:hypothetical protein
VTSATTGPAPVRPEVPIRVVIAVDPGDPDAMHRPPRDPKRAVTPGRALSAPGVS